MTHTPGPWRAALGDDDPGPRDGEFELACLEHHIYGTNIYAPGASYSEDYAEHVANARLVAAAPDLLAACKHVVEWFARLKDEQHRKLDHSFAEAERNWPTLGDDTGPLDLQPLLDAIAKAEGLEKGSDG